MKASSFCVCTMSGFDFGFSSEPNAGITKKITRISYAQFNVGKYGGF